MLFRKYMWRKIYNGKRLSVYLGIIVYASISVCLKEVWSPKKEDDDDVEVVELERKDCEWKI